MYIKRNKSKVQMINKMDTLNSVSFPKLSQSSLSFFLFKYMDMLNWTDRVSFGKLTGFQGSHFVYLGEGGILVVGVCVRKYVGVIMRFEWYSLGVRVGCVGVGWVCVLGDMGGWMHEF